MLNTALEHSKVLKMVAVNVVFMIKTQPLPLNSSQSIGEANLGVTRAGHNRTAL